MKKNQGLKSQKRGTKQREKMIEKYDYYLSGPMTGYDDYNFPAFHEASKKLRAMGYSVFNPAESFDGRTDLEWTTYLAEDFKAIAESAAVVLLEGWEQGVGAIMEVLVAVSTGKNVFEMHHYGHMEKLFDAHKQDARKFVEKYLGKSEPKDESTPSNSAKDMQDETILEEAHRLVHSDRGNSYGHPFFDFSRTARIWSAILDIDVTPEQVALCMVGLKISREVNMPKRDNRVDGAGYFETLQMVIDKKKELGL